MAPTPEIDKIFCDLNIGTMTDHLIFDEDRGPGESNFQSALHVAVDVFFKTKELA